MFTNPRQSIGALRLMIPLMLALWSAASAEEIRRESDPHEHGAAELHVVLEGTTLHLELRVPAMNVVGFEHAPSDDEQRRAIAAVGETLGRSADVFMPTPQAGCREKRAHATFEAFEQGHEDGEKRAGQDGKERHGEPEDDDHSEVHAEYEYECASPDNLVEIRTRLFTLYPGIARIDTEIIAAGGQTAATMTAESPVAQLPR